MWNGWNSQPWRCLWRGLFLQMTMTLPLRRMTRQCSHMGLTLGATFIFFFSRCLRTDSLIEHVEFTNQPLLSSFRAPGWRYL